MRKHAAEGGIIPGERGAYYARARNNLRLGRKFKYRHDGHDEARLGHATLEGRFLFTASTFSRKRIDTHFVVDEESLNGLGITLPTGF